MPRGPLASQTVRRERRATRQDATQINGTVSRGRRVDDAPGGPNGGDTSQLPLVTARILCRRVQCRIVPAELSVRRTPGRPPAAVTAPTNTHTHTSRGSPLCSQRLCSPSHPTASDATSATRQTDPSPAGSRRFPSPSVQFDGRGKRIVFGALGWRPTAPVASFVASSGEAADTIIFLMMPPRRLNMTTGIQRH